MSELHKFLFEGLPVRGMLVRLTESWQESIARREATGSHVPEVRAMLGEMAAAAVLMQANLKFNGALVLQIFGDGPVRVAVAEAQPDLAFRTTAKVVGEVAAGSGIEALVNVHGQGRCAITLDPKGRLPGQQTYQGVVPLRGLQGQALGQVSQVLEQYMRQSEQLDTRIVLAADERVAAGLLIQRLPVEGVGNLERSVARDDDEARDDGFERIALLAGTLERAELLSLDADTLLRRLFWQERLARLATLHPRFACSCSRERVQGMLRSLGRAEADSVIAERGLIEVGCDFCGQQYRFDAVDVGELFAASGNRPGAPGSVN